jgi:peptidoglycan/LPS O-acetylase OafA/YrhL
LRALAVTSVVFFHADLFPFHSGFVGVDIFFVISGYLIGGIVLRETHKGHFDFANFYARRARRILPALFVVVLAACLAGWFLFDAHEYYDLGVSGTLALIGASNINLWQFQDYFSPDSRLKPLLMTWSLGVEEQFYLVFPWLLLATIRFAPRRVFGTIALVSIVSFIVELWWTWTSPATAFFLFPARAWELGVGAGLAAWEIHYPQEAALAHAPSPLRESRALFGVVLLSAGIFGLNASTPFPGFAALLPVFGTALVISARGSFLNARVLSFKPLVFVGLISYSWYLWHWPLMSFLRIVSPGEMDRWVLPAAAAASFILAILSWRYVETPLRRIALPTPRVLLRYGVALALVVAVPFTIKISLGVPQRLSPEAKHVEALAMAGRAEPCLLLDGSKLNRSASCVAPIAGRPSVGLIGDSHAAALAPGVRDAAAKQNLGFAIFTKSSCEPLLDVDVWSRDYPQLLDDCGVQKRNALDRFIADPNIKTVLLAGQWAAPIISPPGSYRYVDRRDPNASTNQTELVALGLQRMIAALTDAGKHVVLVGDVPHWDFDPLRLALDQTIPLRGALAWHLCADCRALRAGEVPAQKVSRDRATDAIVRNLGTTSGDKVRFLDAFDRFCDETTCRFEIAGAPLYFDNHHLTPQGADVALTGFEILNAKTASP